MRDTRQLLAEAGRVFDDRSNGLAALATMHTARGGFGGLCGFAGFGGFASGAAWMQRALAVVRGTAQPAHIHPFTRLGVAKYSLALLAALATAATCFAAGPRTALAQFTLLPLAVVAFYAVEVRMVFAFPLALDGAATPLRDSHRLVAQTMTAPAATLRVMRIAALMLLGGLGGHGFVRSWCVGCLAVVLWYEHAPARHSG